jgi:glyoxylase-like metal-dependent hydrolase (beta-lactamase superfamily II)
VQPLASGISYVDLEFRGRPGAVATAVVQGAGQVGLIDPGPSSCLPMLERRLAAQGIAPGDVTHLLLTHIHLDHAGAAGTLVRRHPHLRVLVHERGAPHMTDPSKLLDSAGRLYGDQMDRLWGEVAPVPVANLTPLAGGERVEVGGRRFDVAYTPGHASHHVSYFDPASGVAFVGDTGGVCIDDGFVLPPTPPPDIDIEAWESSVARVEAWSPATLFMTHFGPVASVAPHLRTLLDHLHACAARVRESLAEPGTDADRRARYLEWLGVQLRRRMDEAQAAAYEAASPLDLNWLGLARYWRKRGQG